MIRICRIIGHKYPKKVITPGSPMIDLKCLRKGCPFYNLKEYVKIYDEDGNFLRHESRQVKDTVHLVQS